MEQRVSSSRAARSTLMELAGTQPQLLSHYAQRPKDRHVLRHCIKHRHSKVRNSEIRRSTFTTDLTVDCCLVRKLCTGMREQSISRRGNARKQPDGEGYATCADPTGSKWPRAVHKQHTASTEGQPGWSNLSLLKLGCIFTLAEQALGRLRMF